MLEINICHANKYYKNLDISYENDTNTDVLVASNINNGWHGNILYISFQFSSLILLIPSAFHTKFFSFYFLKLI